MLHDMAEKSHLTIIQTLKSITISKHKSALRHKEKKIIFGSKRQAENQLKTYLMSPHMLDNNTTTEELCYNGQRLFTKPMFEHFPTTEDSLTWKYHA